MNYIKENLMTSKLTTTFPNRGPYSVPADAVASRFVPGISVPLSFALVPQFYASSADLIILSSPP